MAPAPLKPWQFPPATSVLRFRNAKIIDVVNGKVIEGNDLFIKDGKFAFSVEEEAEVETIDLNDKYYLCPGLINSYIHLTAAAGHETMRELFDTNLNTVAYRTAWHCKTILRRGFTTVRDTGGADFALKQALAEGAIIGPRVFIAGRALSQTGGHGDLRQTHQGAEFKCCDHNRPGFGRVCDGVPQCLEAARDELRQGADFLKIMIGGGVVSPADPIDMLQFTAEEIRAITTVAGQMGKYVTAHAYTAEAIRHAVDNGCKGIEHGNFIDHETAKLCAEKGVTITPTLYFAMLDPPYDEFLPPEGQLKNQQIIDNGFAALNTIHDAGVPLGYGSDLLTGMCVRQNDEFAIRAKALPDVEVLRSATVTGAKLVGCETSLGQIESGFIADLIILNSNPLENVSILSSPDECTQAVIKEGRVVTSKVKGLPPHAMYI
ncbi:hypothetical protein SCUCBS95973_008387 [Sporothrix curviconia]|uniref:Amidohydrolase-related domain-containing protein n=1 Tax=Sporothrix curviconia TaxID=1260050 RepID=A0ABP0CL44_9PEZI